MNSTSASQTARFVLTITTPAGSTDDRSVAVQGALLDRTGASVGGRSVEIDEAGVSLGTATVSADGLWAIPVLLQDLGSNTLTAKTAGVGSEMVTSAPVVLNLVTVLSGTTHAEQSIFPSRGAQVSGEGSGFTFVFRAHPGHTVVDGFGLFGSGADHLSLPAAVFSNIADVLHHTTMAGDDAVIHFSPRDSVTLVGVSRSSLRSDRNALQLHG